MAMHTLVRAVCAGALLALLPALADAQEIGVKAGINSASLTPSEDEDPDTSRRIGFVGGAWVRLPLTPGFSFQAEGLFAEKGVTFNIPAGFGAGAGEIAVRLRYVEIPLLARGDFGASGSSTRFFVVGGAVPAFRLSARIKATLDGREESRDFDDEIEGFDFGLAGGAGVEFGPFMIEGRYTHGVIHINTDDNGDEDRIKNRVISVMFGVRLR